MDIIKNEAIYAKKLLKRFKNKDFSGNTGQAIKNSSYQLTTNVLMKIGALLFTIIIARILLPEKYGLYALALSTIAIFFSFSDFGIKQALIVFSSKFLSKKNAPKAKGHLKKLLIWKITLLSISSLILLISSYFIANYYYNKPIFYALLAGAIYLPIVGILAFLESIFYIENKFKYPLIKEIVFQLLRLLLVPLAIFLLIKTSISTDMLIASIILIISACYLAAILILLYLIKKNIFFIKAKSEKLTPNEISNLKKFIYPLGTMALSGFFFGYIDMIMLGRYITKEFIAYIAYYGITFTLVSSAAAILTFSSTGLAPIFARIKGNSLENLFKKTRNATLSLVIFAGIFTFLLSNPIIKIIYGSEYLPATLFLRIFSLLIIIIPITSIYTTYFISKEKTSIVAKLLIGTTILNIILNYFFITYGIQFGAMQAVTGVCIATIISRTTYLGGLIAFRK
jgi:O-antigen/teichoic acid export membrane protein